MTAGTPQQGSLYLALAASGRTNNSYDKETTTQQRQWFVKA